MRLSSFIYETARILTPRDSRLLIYKIVGFLGRNLSDEEYLKRMYKFRVGRELNLTNPKTFNERIQWSSSMIIGQNIQSWPINTP